MADKLTPQQAQAVSDRGGKLLVSAAAGSGKTKVLVDRLLAYLTDPVDPANLDEFLIITYTKAAASELRGKIAAKLTERIAVEPENRHLQKQMQRLFLTQISTVHGFCGDLLREYAYKLDIPADFRVADENECQEIRETVLRDLLDRAYEHSDDADFRAFIDTQGLGRTDSLVPEIILSVYDAAKCHLDPDGWLQECLNASSLEGVEDVSDTVWGKYLIKDLFSYLDAQIYVMKQCTVLVGNCDGMEKAEENLRCTLMQLEDLRNCRTWDEIVQHRTIDYGRLNFPRKNNPDPELSERVKAARNACKKGLEKKLHSFSDLSAQVLMDLEQSSGATRGLVALVRQFDRDFTRAKRVRRVLDFGDLEHLTLGLLLGKSRSQPTAAAGEIGRRYREIMVDEYQDSNGVQDAIFEVLTRERQNCFMVGDVKQSIYQFRLADPGIFLKKYNSYASAGSAEVGEGRKVLLSHNFRSGGEVIEAVNDVFQSCMSKTVGGLDYGEAEALREGIPHEPLPDSAVELHAIEVQEDTYKEEAAYVADRIQSMLRDGTLIRKNGILCPVEAEDIVILLRSPGSVGGYYQRALEARGIRCSSGGGMDLLQTEEIGTLRSFLQIVVNPRQDIPLISTLASPVFGFTADDLAIVRADNKKCSFYEALQCCDMPKVKTFLGILRILRREAQMQPLTSLLERIFLLTRLDSIYGAMQGGEARKANIQTFFQLAANFEKGSMRDLGQFLEHLDALQSRGLIAAGAASSGCVTIMSIHKSKGLEFPVVFLCGLSKSFNRESLQAQILFDRELGLGLSVADRKNRIRYPSVAKRAIAARMASESLSEEMRVLYVAMTRARDRLIMTYSVRNLADDLQDISLRMDFDGGKLLCRDAVCSGEWVLLAAMKHMEAGTLHAVGGKPADTHLGIYPWKILVSEAPGKENGNIDTVTELTDSILSQEVEEMLRKALRFEYGHLDATRAPSKQTATGRKGRHKDSEVAENTKEVFKKVSWREASFRRQKKEGLAYGSAIHAALQYIRYESCGSISSVKAEVNRLVEKGFLAPEQGKLVNCEALATFFQTPIGQKLRSGIPHIREFKFSILDDGENYGENLKGEQILLQGVVDCALLEADGITVLDFKTDNVTEGNLSSVVEGYRVQVETYGEALSRIYEMPIKGRYLYFFRLNQFVEV